MQQTTSNREQSNLFGLPVPWINRFGYHSADMMHGFAMTFYMFDFFDDITQN